MSRTIRILSDIHFGHRATLAQRTEVLHPLLEGADHIVFNGDTLEQKYRDSTNQSAHSLPTLEEFRSALELDGVETTFITGNHDPEISDTHFMEFADGDVFATHGDLIYPNVAPWSSQSRILTEVANSIVPNEPGQGRKSLNAYLSLLKEVSLKAHAMDRNDNPTYMGKLKIFLHQAWPPTRPFTILKSWNDAPQKMLDTARRFGLDPKVILFGHIHKPSVNKIDDTWLINTGSFFPWPGAYAVDLVDRIVTVRKVARARRAFTLGAEIARFSIPRARIGSGDSTAAITDSSRFAPHE